MAVDPAARPIRLVVRADDLRRTRLTVFFRLFLAIPHFIWVTLWGMAAFVVAFILWLAVLIEGEAPENLHGFVAGYVRYATHVGAYVFLAADPYPGFRGAPGYPVDVEIDPPAPQRRWTGFLRLLLAVPAVLLTASLGGSLAFGWVTAASTVAVVSAFLVWFAALASGRSPRGLRDLIAYALGYGAQTTGYAMLLTGRYPSSDPSLVEPPSDLPEHPVRIVVTDDLGRSRLTVFLRILLATPHVVWLMLWSFVAILAAFAAWFAALALGRVPTPLHRFLAAYVRYSTHVGAFVTLVGRRFPGFTGRAGSYGIDVEIDPPQPQSRSKTLARLFLAAPALLLSAALSGPLWVAALLGWWGSIVRGSAAGGMRNLGASCLRYNAQTTAYLWLLTDRYPAAAPVLEKPPEQICEPSPASPYPLTGDLF